MGEAIAGRTMPPHDYPDVLRALSDFALEHGRDGEAATMREIADWIEGDYPKPPKPPAEVIFTDLSGAEVWRCPARFERYSPWKFVAEVMLPRAMEINYYEVIDAEGVNWCRSYPIPRRMRAGVNRIHVHLSCPE